jgi:prepilin-type N-terminal cleavage/methylation domain-containing protein
MTRRARTLIPVARASRPCTSTVRAGRPDHRFHAFTLTELLVVMAVLVVLGTVTIVAARGMAKDARLSSAMNTITATLANARAVAIRDNRMVLVVFRPRLISDRQQVIDLVMAQWSGESIPAPVSGISPQPVDRFVPIPNAPVRSLPSGIGIAGPNYGGNDDDTWQVAAHLPAINEETGAGEFPGVLLGIMFGPKGTVTHRISVMDSARSYVDFDRNGLQDFGPCRGAGTQINYWTTSAIPQGSFNDLFFRFTFECDEPFISLAPFFAVYDDEAAREIYNEAAWSNAAVRDVDLKAFIERTEDRIHFNRYTGVVLK